MIFYIYDFTIYNMKGLLKAAIKCRRRERHPWRLAICGLIFPSLPIPINYVTKRFQLRSLTIPITKASKEGNLEQLKVSIVMMWQWQSEDYLLILRRRNCQVIGLKDQLMVNQRGKGMTVFAYLSRPTYLP